MTVQLLRSIAVKFQSFCLLMFTLRGSNAKMELVHIWLHMMYVAVLLSHKNQCKKLVYCLVFFTAKCLCVSLLQTQAALLTKYLWIGKHCYESRNFATAMQVLGGLENVIVRQLPVCLHLINCSSCWFWVCVCVCNKSNVLQLYVVFHWDRTWVVFN